MVQSAGDSTSLVSAVDIDLAWRVHRLDTYRYISETEKVTGVALAEPRSGRHSPAAVRKTSKMWKAMFGLDF